MPYSIILIHQVVWRKQGDYYPLTVGNFLFINDNRFGVQHESVNQWNLLIDDVILEDQGEYRCIIYTKPLLSKQVFLQVVGKVICDSQSMHRHEGLNQSFSMLIIVVFYLENRLQIS